MDTTKTLHYQRQFLASEQTRYDQSSCQTYVEVHDLDDPPAMISSELLISDGHNACSFFVTLHDEDDYDEHLAAITKLMEQVIAYRQAYAEALATVRGQVVTRGAASIVLNIDTSGTP